MNILFSLDENYVKPLKVLLQSLLVNHPIGVFDFYLLHQGISEKSLDELKEFVGSWGHRLNAYDGREFLGEQLEKAFINRHYTLEMYLWLFAPYILPEEVERALYLDPDIVNMNDMSELYYLELEGNLFAAASFDYKNDWIQVINNLRLGNFEAEKYFNTGIVLMDVKELRETTTPDDILQTIAEKEKRLYLPDQDIFNILFEDKTKQIPWQKYNLDPRAFDAFHLLPIEQFQSTYVEDKAVFIHYCGRHKPWEHRNKYRYSLGNQWFIYEEILKKHQLEIQ